MDFSTGFNFFERDTVLYHFPVYRFNGKDSGSSSSPNEAVLSVKLDFVKKTIPKYVLFCLIGFTDASLEDSRLVQLAVVMSYGANRINLINLYDSRKVANIEALLPLCDCQSIVGVALGKHQQLLSGCLCDVASGLNDWDR